MLGKGDPARALLFGNYFGCFGSVNVLGLSVCVYIFVFLLMFCGLCDFGGGCRGLVLGLGLTGVGLGV